MKYIFLIVIVLSGIFLLEVYIDLSHISQPPVLDEMDSKEKKIETYQKITDYWTAHIKKKSASESYRFMKETYKNYSVDQKHLVAHLFGEALYSVVGSEGLSICDHEYSYGCSHQLIAQTLFDQGPLALKEIDSFCKKNYDCQHGIGHGLISFYGYSKEALKTALEACYFLGSVDPLDGCYGGIFMEYNTRTTVDMDYANIRLLEEGELRDSVCSQVPEYAHPSCYFWLPQWFLADYSGDLEEKAQRGLEDCANIEDRKNRLTCVVGFGYEITIYSQDIDVLKKICESLGVSGGGEQVVSHCKNGVAAALFIQPQTTARASMVCEGLSIEKYKDCLKYATWSDGRRVLADVD